jgi:hypothetical protein
MQALLNHIETARQQPHHVRKQIAFVVAGGVATLVALVWVGLSMAMGSFDLKGPTSFGQGTYPADGSSTNTQLASVGAALPSTAESSKPHIEIVDVAPAKSDIKTEKTYIPF